MSESVEDIVARLQRRVDLYGGRADFHALMKSYADLETSWRERGEALRPFAEHATYIDREFGDHDDDVIAAGHAAAPVTIGDFRRARGALSSAERSSPQESSPSQ